MRLQHNQATKHASLTVDFLSIGAGTDELTGQRIRALLESDPAVIEVQPYLRGREGETTLCIRLREEGEIDRLFDTLKGMVPDLTEGRRVSIRTKSGLEFSN